jgi:hypothetical protein
VHVLEALDDARSRRLVVTAVDDVDVLRLAAWIERDLELAFPS